MLCCIALGYPLGLTIADGDNTPKYCLEFMRKRELLSIAEFSIWAMVVSNTLHLENDNRQYYDDLVKMSALIEIDTEKDISLFFAHHTAIRQGSGSVDIDQMPCVSMGNKSIKMTEIQMQVWQSMCTGMDMIKIIRWLRRILSAEEIMKAIIFLMREELLYII